MKVKLRVSFSPFFHMCKKRNDFSHFKRLSIEQNHIKDGLKDRGFFLKHFILKMNSFWNLGFLTLPLGVFFDTFFLIGLCDCGQHLAHPSEDELSLM